MRTEEEVRRAAEAFAWLIASGRINRQNYETRQNILGTIAAIEWVLGTDDGTNPVAGTLRDIGAMRQGPGRN
jgi:hypothetical protein